MCTDHNWINNAIRKIEADFQRSADTHLIKLDLPSVEGSTFTSKMRVHIRQGL